MTETAAELERLLADHKAGASTTRLRKCLGSITPTAEIGSLLSNTLDVFAGDLKMLRRIGEIFLVLDDVPRAGPFLERAFALDESHLKTRRRLARHHRKQGNWDAARLLLEPAARHRRAIWMDFLNLAIIHAELGNEQEHVENLRRAWAMHPADAAVREQLLGVLRAAGKHEEADEVLRRSQEVPAKLTPRDLLDCIAQAGFEGSPRFVVNIGCRDGKSLADPCYDLFQMGYAGLAVDAGNFPAIFEHLPQPDVKKLLNVTVTPMNVVDTLREGGTPTHFDFLSIDIDSFDGVLLDPILQVFTPRVVHIEVNYEIPPPVRFAVEYHADYRHGCGAGFWGCSVSYVAATGRQHGYVLLQLDWTNHPLRQDVVLIREEYLGAFGLSSPPDERSLFNAEPATRGSFDDIGIDSTAWRAIENPDELLLRVREACLAGSIKRNGKVLPFVLTI